MTCRIILNPKSFDTIVATNLCPDILSDLAACRRSAKVRSAKAHFTTAALFGLLLMLQSIALQSIANHCRQQLRSLLYETRHNCEAQPKQRREMMCNETKSENPE